MPWMAITLANVKVLEALMEDEENKERSQGPYLSLTPAQKHEINKQAAEHTEFNASNSEAMVLELKVGHPLMTGEETDKQV